MLAMGTVSAATPSISGCPVHGVECRRTWASRLGAPLSPRSTKWSWQELRNNTRLTWLEPRKYQVCSGDGSGEEGKEGGGSGWSLEWQVDKMLGDAESQALIQDLNAAVERVARARRELDDIDEQQRRAGRTDSVEAADSLVEEYQRDVFAAEADVKNAEIALVKARAGSSIWDISEVKWENGEDIDEDAERMESGKVAAVSGIMGTLAGLPFFLAASLDGIELAVSAGFLFASCALFGLTYRYAVRRDLVNTQLKAGCVAAFVLVRGLGQIDATKLLLGLPEDANHKLFQGFLFVAESVAVFSFAAVSLEYCFRQGLISPFPLRQQ